MSGRCALKSILSILKYSFNLSICLEECLTILIKLHNFISIVKNSSKQMDKLKEYFRIDNVDFKAPLPDIITRWNYTYYMIERALEIKPFLIHLVSGLPTLTKIGQQMMNGIF